MACHQHTQQDYKNLLRDLTTLDNLWLVTNTLSKITIIFQGIFKQMVKVTSHTTVNLPQIPEGFSNNWLRLPATQQRICHRLLQDLRYNFGLATTQQRTCHRSHFMMEQNLGFAWEDSERGRFREDFFPPIEMPVIPHTPWVLKNIPISPGLYPKVCEVIRTKIDAGVYEPSNSAYISRWFGFKERWC